MAYERAAIAKMANRPRPAGKLALNHLADRSQPPDHSLLWHSGQFAYGACKMKPVGPTGIAAAKLIEATRLDYISIHAAAIADEFLYWNSG